MSDNYITKRDLAEFSRSTANSIPFGDSEPLDHAAFVLESYCNNLPTVEESLDIIKGMCIVLKLSLVGDFVSFEIVEGLDVYSFNEIEINTCFTVVQFINDVLLCRIHK